MWNNPALNPLMPSVEQRIQAAAAPVKNMMQAMKTMQDPQTALRQMLQNNPNYQQASTWNAGPYPPASGT